MIQDIKYLSEFVRVYFISLSGGGGRMKFDLNFGHSNVRQVHKQSTCFKIRLMNEVQRNVGFFFTIIQGRLTLIISTVGEL